MKTILGFEVYDTLEERIGPAHTALLVVDMQNDYCSPGGASDKNKRDITAVQALIPRLAGVIDSARRAGAPIVFAKYTVGPGNAGLSGPEIMRRGVLFSNVDATVKGTWGHDIISELPYRPEEDVVVEKRRLSCFVGTELDLLLRFRGIKSLVVTGVVTQGCVETTVRDAACLDYYAAVVEDCCASTSAALHQAGIASMGTFLRYDDAVTTADRVAGIWDKCPRA